MNKTIRIKRSVILLCIVFLIIYISVSFIPHIHDCHGQECAVCVLIDSCEILLNVLLLFSVFCSLPDKSFGIKDIRNNITVAYDRSLVRLKVKLSD